MSLTFTLTAAVGTGTVIGYDDGLFLTTPVGSISPSGIQLGGNRYTIGSLFSESNVSEFVFALDSPFVNPGQGSIESITFTDHLGNPQTFLAANASYVYTAGVIAFWEWSGTVPSQLFAAGPFTITVNLPAAPAVTPSTPSLEVNNGETQQFTASGFANSVNWSVDGLGSITDTGLYTAPTVSVMPTTPDTVVATDSVDGVTTATATVTLTPPTINLTPRFVPAAQLNGPLMLANVSDIVPKIYMPAENRTVRSRQ